MMDILSVAATKHAAASTTVNPAIVDTSVFRDFTKPMPPYRCCANYYESANPVCRYNCSTVVNYVQDSNIVKDWKRCLYPKVSTGLGGFKVCAADSYSSATCSWVVPAGVTKAQFQLWGAGGVTNQVCCCSVTPFGVSGAYQLVTMNVTPGETIVLNSGCNCSNNNSQSCINACGSSSSYICKASEFTFFASGGFSDGSPMAADYGSYSKLAYQQCMFNACDNVITNKPSTSSPTNFGWCTQPETTVRAIVPMSYASHVTWGDITTADRVKTTRNVTQYGVNGLWGALNYLCHGDPNSALFSAPSVGFDGCVYAFSITTSSCSGCQRGVAQGYPYVPGHGGSPTIMAGGSTCYGDWGRMGMICVTCIR